MRFLRHREGRRAFSVYTLRRQRVNQPQNVAFRRVGVKMSKNARVFVGIAWLFLGVFVSLKGENFLLRHQWYSVGLGAAWTLAYLAISGGKTADSELRSKRFHMLWFLGSAAIGTLFLAFSFI